MVMEKNIDKSTYLDCEYIEESWDDMGSKQVLCNADVNHTCPCRKQQRSGYEEHFYLCTAKNK